MAVGQEAGSVVHADPVDDRARCALVAATNKAMQGGPRQVEVASQSLDRPVLPGFSSDGLPQAVETVLVVAD